MYCLGQGAVSTHDADHLSSAVVVILAGVRYCPKACFPLLLLENVVKPYLTVNGLTTLVELNSVIIDLREVGKKAAGEAIPRARVSYTKNLVALEEHLLLRFLHVAPAGTPLSLFALWPLAEGAFSGLGARSVA